MAKIICGTSGLTGITNSSLELLLRLKKDGHDILYVSPRNIKEKVTQSSFSYFQLPEILSETQLEIPDFSGILSKTKRYLHKIINSNKLQSAALLELRPKAFKQVFLQYKPDITILDVELHEYIMFTSSQDTQLILLSQWFCLRERSGLPYLLHDTIPGRGFSGTGLGMWLSWRKVRIQRHWTFLKKKIRSVGTDRRSTLLNYANEVGFNKQYIYENNWPGPFVYNTIPMMSMTMAELEFPHDHQLNLKYVGPMIFDGRKDHTLTSDDNEKLIQVLKHKKQMGKRIIYCSVSTLHTGDQLFMQKVLEAVRGIDDWVLMLSMGGIVDLGKFSDIPTNVYPMTFAPQLDILKHSDCSINHGGIHTINECIHYQVPMLVYSGKRSDQNGCAARVAYHNLGIRADKDLDTTTIIKSKIEEILANPGYMKSMRLFHKKYLKYKSDRVLEEFIVKSLIN